MLFKSNSGDVLCVCVLPCRRLVVLPDTHPSDEAHLGVQKRTDLHAQKWPPVNSQPRSEIPAERPQAALQSQCSVFLSQSAMVLVP